MSAVQMSIMASAVKRAVAGRADNFNRANTTAPSIGTPSDGGAVTVVGGSPSISSNRLQMDSDATVTYTGCPTSGVVTVTVDGGTPGNPQVIFRNTGSDFLIFRPGGSGFGDVAKFVASSFVDTIITFNSGFAYDGTPTTYVITFNASQIVSITKGGVTPTLQQGSFPQADTTGSAGTSVSLTGGSNFTATYFDNFSVA